MTEERDDKLMADASKLATEISPERDLWPEIEARLSEPLFEDAAASLEQRRNGLAARASRRPVQPLRRVRFKRWQAAALAAVAPRRRVYCSS